MRLLGTSDWHIDAVTLGIARRPEVLGYIKKLVHAVREHKVDVVIFSGDAFDPANMMVSLYTADVAEAFCELAASARLGILLGIPGNHDIIEVDYPLSTLKPVTVRGWHSDAGVLIAEEPSVVVVAHEVAFVLLPYYARAWSSKEAERGVGPASLTALAMQTAHEEKKKGRAVVTIGHQTVPGASLGSESREMSRGRDLDIPIDALVQLRPNCVINGHYHCPQIVHLGSGIDVVIPGSPLSFTTDDPAAGKGYVIVDI